MTAQHLLRLSTAVLALFVFAYHGAALAQKRYVITKAPNSSGQYLQQHAIDAEDAPDHQVRVFETRNTFPEKDFAFAGVAVKESRVRGMSDYVNFNGPYIQYTVYELEDGNKVFGRGTGTSQMFEQPDGSRLIKFSFVENFTGGTGKFRGITGQVRGSGQRVPNAKTVSFELTGEYALVEEPSK